MRDDLLFPRVIDYTMWSTWKKCPHKFFREHVQGLQRPGKSIHLHFGGAVAKGLEGARRYYASTGDASDALEVGSIDLIQEWGDYEPEARTRSEANKTLQNALLALRQYFYEWPLDDDFVSIHRHNGEPCIEFSAAWPIPGSRHPDTGEPILYAGRFDFIGDYEASVWGVDDKTASVDPKNETWQKQWKLRGQFSGYCWLAQQYGLDLRGFIVRGMGILTDSVRTGWCLTPRPPWMIEAWLRQLQDDVATMVLQYEDLESRLDAGDFECGLTMAHPFPQDFSDACSDFGGCAFLDLCTAEHPSNWLGDYEVRRWNPLTRTED